MSFFKHRQSFLVKSSWSRTQKVASKKVPWNHRKVGDFFLEPTDFITINPHQIADKRQARYILEPCEHGGSMFCGRLGRHAPELLSNTLPAEWSLQNHPTKSSQICPPAAVKVVNLHDFFCGVFAATFLDVAGWWKGHLVDGLSA